MKIGSGGRLIINLKTITEGKTDEKKDGFDYINRRYGLGRLGSQGMANR
jgi:hypothetical protein